MGVRRGVLAGLAATALVAGVVYVGYVAFEGSRQLVDGALNSRDCRTPAVQFGWPYEAINYNIADDARLRKRNSDLRDCIYQGTPAGLEVVTSDGIHIAGWYIPAASGIGPTGPTVILVHGFHGNKSGILKYGAGLHPAFNLVAFDMRNTGRSSGTQGTAGVLEQRDLRAVVDWLKATKHPDHIGVLGNSLGAATALAEAGSDPRVEALTLDSMHTRTRYQIEARLQQAGHPAYPGTWAIFVGAWLRTGVDLGAIDAEDKIGTIGTRPVLLIHGTADAEDLPARTTAFYEALQDAGVSVALDWCPDAGHQAPAVMPVEVCQDDFSRWVAEFFAAAFQE